MLTIFPLTREPAWLEAPEAVPRSRPAPVAAVVLAPDPDDEMLDAGRLIASLRTCGVPISVIAITDGEDAYVHAPGLGQVRVQERLKHAAVQFAIAIKLSLTFSLFWLGYRGAPAILNGQHLRKVVLSARDEQRHEQVIPAHSSQLKHHDGQAQLSDELPAPASHLRRTYTLLRLQQLELV